MRSSFDQSEAARRSQDGGRAARAWRWFSKGTIEAALHHRDVPWSKLATQAGLAFLVIAVSRIDPGFALSPWLFIGGLGWSVFILRAVVLKAFDTRRG